MQSLSEFGSVVYSWSLKLKMFSWGSYAPGWFSKTFYLVYNQIIIYPSVYIALTYYTICSVFGIVFHLKITLLKIVSAHSIHKIIICCYHNKIRWPNPIWIWLEIHWWLRNKEHFHLLNSTYFRLTTPILNLIITLKHSRNIIWQCGRFIIQIQIKTCIFKGCCMQSIYIK